MSCPLLVQAIDQLEDEGGIEDVNARLAIDEDLREVSGGRVSDLAHAYGKTTSIWYIVLWKGSTLFAKKQKRTHTYTLAVLPSVLVPAISSPGQVPAELSSTMVGGIFGNVHPRSFATEGACLVSAQLENPTMRLLRKSIFPAFCSRPLRNLKLQAWSSINEVDCSRIWVVPFRRRILCHAHAFVFPPATFACLLACVSSAFCVGGAMVVLCGAAWCGAGLHGRELGAWSAAAAFSNAGQDESGGRDHRQTGGRALPRQRNYRRHPGEGNTHTRARTSEQARALSMAQTA